MTLTIEQIKKKLSAIKKLGYVKTLRNGPTGIGYTLETLLEIRENNISSPDFGEIELKTQRERHSGMTTLFTFNNKAWQMNPLEAIRKYGSLDKDGRLGMYYTMGMKPNSAGLFLTVNDTSIAVRHIDGNVIAIWQLSEIEKRFEAKVKNVLLVKAKVEERDGVEYFLFDRARLLSGGTTQAILKNQFENEQLLVDLRLHDKGTMARNHGTGFRVFENNLENLYEKIQEIAF
jgi:MvaI/BcnI restriction endonuclease family